MGTICCKDSSRPSVDVYLDKLIKYIVLPVVFLLGLVSLIILYLVEKVKCYNTYNRRDYFADEFCWNSFVSASRDSTSSKWVPTSELPHKIFPIILLCEPVALALPLIIWYWCFGREFSNEIHSLIGHSNNLTEYYRKYDKGMRRTVTEATLHREIDNVLEYFAYILMVKSKQMFVLYLIKWCTLIIIIVTCIGACLGIIYQDQQQQKIFADKFTCLVQPDQTPAILPTQSQRTAVCNIPTYMFLRAIWFFNIVVLGLLFIATLIQMLELSIPRQYTDSFLYRNMPGMTDSRLADCIQKYFNLRHLHLISKFCDQNIHLCSDTGLSKSLARKYGIFEGKTPGRGTIMDKHFPVIQSDQIDRFRFSSELFFRKKPKTIQKKSIKVAPLKKERLFRTSGSENPSSGYDSFRKSHEGEDDSLNYMTPHLMARRLEKEERDNFNFSLNYTIGSQTRTPLPTQRSLASDITFEDLEFQTSTPRPVLRNDNTEHLYGKRYGVNFDPKIVGHYPKFVSRTRELNPFAYRLRNVIRQNKADNMNKWKP